VNPRLEFPDSNDDEDDEEEEAPVAVRRSHTHSSSASSGSSRREGATIGHHEVVVNRHPSAFPLPPASQFFLGMSPSGNVIAARKTPQNVGYNSAFHPDESEDIAYADLELSDAVGPVRGSAGTPVDYASVAATRRRPILPPPSIPRGFTPGARADV